MNENKTSTTPIALTMQSNNSWLYIKLTSFSGMVGGAIGRFICHPIDTVKAKIYVIFIEIKIH